MSYIISVHLHSVMFNSHVTCVTVLFRVFSLGEKCRFAEGHEGSSEVVQQLSETFISIGLKKHSCYCCLGLGAIFIVFCCFVVFCFSQWCDTLQELQNLPSSGMPPPPKMFEMSMC